MLHTLFILVGLTIFTLAGACIRYPAILAFICAPTSWLTILSRFYYRNRVYFIWAYSKGLVAFNVVDKYIFGTWNYWLDYNAWRIYLVPLRVKGGSPFFILSAGVAAGSMISYVALVYSTPVYDIHRIFRSIFGGFSQVPENLSISETLAKAKQLDAAIVQYEDALKVIDKEVTRTNYLGLVCIVVGVIATGVCCCICFFAGNK